MSVRGNGIEGVVLTTTETAYYTAPDTADFDYGCIGFWRFINVTTDPVKVTVHCVPLGDSVAAANVHFYEQEIMPGSWPFDEAAHVTPGMSITAKAASDSAVTFKFSMIEVYK